MARNYVAIPFDYRVEMEELDDAAFGRLVRLLLDYGMTGIEPEKPAGEERFYFRRVIEQENRFRESYDTQTLRNQENGKKGGRPKTQGNPEKPTETHGNPEKPTVTQKTHTETETETNIYTIPPKGGNSKGRARKEATKKTEPKAQWAENVTMTNAEYQALLDTHGPADTTRLIEILDNYKGCTGKTYASDYRAILSWCVDKLDDERQKQARKPVNGPAVSTLTESGVMRANQDMERMRRMMAQMKQRDGGAGQCV